MIEINPKRWKTEPYKHQVEGVRELVTKPAFALFDEMGSGKSKQVIDAACVLTEAGAVDAVVVVAPASVRNVWLDKELGQIAKHCWKPTIVVEYHKKARTVWNSGDCDRALPFFVTNYEYLRPTGNDNHRLEGFKHLLKGVERILLVLDESSAVKSRGSGQFWSVDYLRSLCVRCVELNGTPISNNPLDLWGQMNILDPKILGRHFMGYHHFRNTFAILEQGKRRDGGNFQKVIGWKNLEQLQEIVKPYCLRRLKKDCLDLPPKIGGIESADPVIQYVPLIESSWKRYKQLRSEALLSLPQGEQVLEANAAVRLLRLAQLTSGHISVNPTNIFQEDLFTGLDWDGEEVMDLKLQPNRVDDVSHEKLDWMFNYLTDWDQNEATIVWCRFRRERERLVAMLRLANVNTFQLYGGQKKAERRAAEVAFDPSARGSGRRVLVAQPHAGGKGLQLHAATENLYLSNDYSLEFRLQSEDRTHRSGTIARVSYTDVLATGPQGQRTIDWIIFKALREKQNLAAWTCAAWRRALEDDDDF